MSEQVEPLEPQLDLPTTSWPKVVGIISIVWGCLGITCMACGVGGIFIGPALMPAEMRNQPLPPTMHLTPLQAGLFVVGFIMSLVLLAAGIQTMRRSLSGRTLHLVWAVVSCFSVVVGLYVAWNQQVEMERWLNENPDSQFAKGPRVSKGTGMAIAGALNGIGLIWPIFCLVWFGAIKRTQASFGAAPVKDYI